MPQINVSISFNIDKEQDLFDAINTGKRSTTVKEAIAFWLKYRDLLPQLDDTSDLLSIVSQMAVQQAEMMSMIASLNERSVVTTESVENSNWLDGQLDMMGDFE